MQQLLEGLILFRIVSKNSKSMKDLLTLEEFKYVKDAQSVTIRVFR